MNQNLRVNKTNFHMKGFALGLALKQRRNATRKSPYDLPFFSFLKRTETNSTIRMCSSRAFILVVTPSDFVYKKMNSSVITQTVLLECTHQELSFEWSHFWHCVEFGSLVLIKFAFGWFP